MAETFKERAIAALLRQPLGDSMLVNPRKRLLTVGDAVSIIRELPEDEPGEVEVRLVPVEVSGAEDGYGLCDAVQSWSDCNRAYGHIFRFDDGDPKYRIKGETLAVRANKDEYERFAQRFWGDKGDDRVLQKPAPTTVLVEMKPDVARWITENADDDTAQAAAEALRKAGL